MPYDPNPTKTVTPRPAPKGAGVAVFKPQTPEQALGVEPSTTKAPNRAPYKPGKAPEQVATKRLNAQRAKSAVPQNPVDPRVVQIQQHLVALGYPVKVDGVMGPLTRFAMGASANGTVPNHVYHPDHSKQQAQDYVNRVRSELRQTTSQGRAGIVKTQFTEPQPRDNMVHPAAPINLRHAPGGGKPIFYQPMFEGQQPTGYHGAFRGPDGRIYYPGEKAPKGSRITQVPYYQADSATAPGQQSILGGTDQQDALRRFKFENEGGLGGALLSGALHPFTDVLQQAAGERKFNAGGALSDVAQIATIGLPVAGPAGRLLGGFADAMQAIRAEGFSAKSLNLIRDLRAFSNETGLAALRAGRTASAAKAVSALPIASLSRDALIQSLRDAPNITNRQVKTVTRLADNIARNIAAAHGITPEEAYSHMLAGAKYHTADPTASEAQGIAQSTAFQRSDITQEPPDPARWDNPRILLEQAKARLPDNPFYSKLHTLVAEMPAKVGVQELLGRLKTAGVKQDEIRWNRFEEFLTTASQKGQKSVTREEALGWLDKNYLQLEQNERGIPGDQYGYSSRNDVNADETKFSSYTLPGGDRANYREITIRLPEDKYGSLYTYTSHFPDSNIIAHVRATDRAIGDDHTLMIEEVQSDWHQAGQKQGYATPVTEHPDYPMRQQAVQDAVNEVDSVTANLRRTLVGAHPVPGNLPDSLLGSWERGIENIYGVNLTDGASVDQFVERIHAAEKAHGEGLRAAVEPVAGTWGHKAVIRRPEGHPIGHQHSGFWDNYANEPTLGMFREDGTNSGYAELAATDRANQINHLIDMSPEERTKIMASVSDLRHALRNLTEKRSLMRALEMDAARGVAPGPFEKTWHELAFKRMLADAVDKGYDRVAWTTGRTQAERYGLANYFKKIEIEHALGHSGVYSDELQQWAEEMARVSAEDMTAEDIGIESLDHYIEQARETLSRDYPQAEDFIDPNTDELDQYSFDDAVSEWEGDVHDHARIEHQDDFERTRDEYISQDAQYYMENAHEYEGAPTSGGLVIHATAHDGSVHDQEASIDSLQDNALENVIGPDLARQYHENGTTTFEGSDLAVGENAKSALGAQHFYDNKLTGFVNKYLKKFGVQVEKKPLGAGKAGPFDYRIDYSPSPRDNHPSWTLDMPDGGKRLYDDYFRAVNAQHDLMHNIPKARVFEATTSEVHGPGYFSSEQPGVWVEWSNFPEGVKEIPNPGVSVQPHYEGWGGKVWGPFDSEKDAAQQVEDLLIHKMREWKLPEQASGTIVHSVPINDAVRAFVDQGQALFQRDPLVKEIKQLHEARVKGAVDLGGREGAVIHLFRRADITTIVHELGHVAQQYMPDLHGLDQEEFARSFERYFAEGKAPDPKQQRLFDKVSTAMLKVYHRVEEIPGANLTPEVRKSFDAFFTREAQRNPAVAKALGATGVRMQSEHAPDPMLTAAAMQVKDGGMEPAKAAEMFKQDEAAVRAEAERLKGGYESTAYNNADVGGGPATTTESAGTILSRGDDLKWLPKGARSNRDAQAVADTYMRNAGMAYDRPRSYMKVDRERARHIANWYDRAQHAPTDPATAGAYQAMMDETAAQYKAITDAGYTFEFYPHGVDPYPRGPQQAMDDLRDNKHLYVFPTEGAFGTEAVTTEHPLLADSGVVWNGRPVTHNDVFRGVHDFFGHFKEGVGFRADGEENAWRAHSAMYSDKARPAMTSETRGQNSWVNFGPHGTKNRTASQADTVYADQKAVLAPDWVVNEGAHDVPNPRLEPFPVEGLPDATRVIWSRPDGTESTILHPNRTEAQRYADELPVSRQPGDHWFYQEDYRYTEGPHTDPARNLAEEHGVDIGKVIGTGKNGRVTVPDVEKYVFEQMSPEDQLRSITQGLKIARGKQEAGYSAERGARFRAAEQHYTDTSLPPEERLIAGKSELKGELPKVVINGKARDMSQDALDHLLATVLQHPTLLTGHKTKVADALIALIREGRTPTRGEISLMQHVWGKDTVSSLQEIASNWHKGMNLALSALNIPRSIMSSMDVSFGMRQALVAGFYDPKTWWKAYRQQFQYLSKYTGGGEEAYQALLARIHAKPNFPIYQEMKLAITDLEHEIGLREEPYQSNLAEKLTIKGHGPGNMIRGSGRAYTGMGITLRTELADKLLAEAAARGQDIHNEDFLHELGHFINGITGRGDLPGKVLQESAPLLNTLFFSPRLLASRLQMLNPRNYLAGDKFVRRQYLRAGLSTFGTLATILGVVKFFAPGAVVGTDWRSSDFGKIKIGDTRIDLGGGFNQLFHLMGMIYSGQKVSSTTGNVSSLTSNKFGQATRADAFVNFLSGKLAPVPSMINDWAKNRNPQHFGQPFNWKDEAASHFQPLIIQDSWNLYNDPVAGMNGIEAAAAGYGLAAQGVGVQTYGPYDPAKKTTDKLTKLAKVAGVPPPSKEILVALDHKANLDHISASHKGDRIGAFKEAVQYYTKVTGKHDFDKLYRAAKKDTTGTLIDTYFPILRTVLVGPGLSAYESAVKTVAKAKGVK